MPRARAIPKVVLFRPVTRPCAAVAVVSFEISYIPGVRAEKAMRATMSVKYAKKRRPAARRRWPDIEASSGGLLFKGSLGWA